MPKVSVVTCTYNRAHLIGETIASVLGQSFQDFEYIIIDDGSVDETERVVREMNDGRIMYFHHSHTEGKLSVLRNFAQTKCSGEYVAYIDSDDLWEKDKLDVQITGMERNSSIGFSFTDIDTFNQEGIIKKSLYEKTGDFTGSVFLLMLLNKLIICHTTLVIRTSCLSKIGPMDETMHSGDHDRVFLLSRHYNAFAVYRPLVHVRKHAQNSTGNPSLSQRLLEEHHATLQKLFKQDLISRSEYLKAYGITSYAFGTQMHSIGNYEAARQYFFKALSSRPFHLKTWIRLAQSLP